MSCNGKSNYYDNSKQVKYIYSHLPGKETFASGCYLMTLISAAIGTSGVNIIYLTKRKYLLL